jgi:hypothetical protein
MLGHTHKSKENWWFTKDKEITYRTAGYNGVNIYFITVQIFTVTLDSRILMAGITTSSIIELRF